MRRIAALSLVVIALIVSLVPAAGQSRTKRPLSSADIDSIATLLMLEDARTFDEAELKRIMGSAHPEVRRRAAQSIGRIANKAGAALLETARQDKDVEVAATAIWSLGQLRDAAAVPVLSSTLSNPRTPAAVAKEAAIALGKIQGPPISPNGRTELSLEARATLAQYLSTTPTAKPSVTTVGEALLSIGRAAPGGDLAPILRWTTAPDVEIRWRAAWALFRSRDPNAVKELIRLSADKSGDVRFWAVRGLIPHPDMDPAPAAARLREAVSDPDRRVRTEALRTLGQHKDDASVKVLLEGLNDKDSWISVSAAEGLGLQPQQAEVIAPRLAAAAGTDRPLSLRLTARQSLGRLAGPGKAALDAAPTEGLPAPAGRGGGGGTRPQPQLLTLAEYRRLVEKWIVPDYNGARKPRAIWETPRGAIELELYPGDSPLGVEYFLRVHDSGEIVGTQFTRLVPNFVAQQRGIRNDVVLRDEVSRRGLTRGNLSWASAGLDTGRPGYTLGVTPQPHNEGNFTALGRIVGGMDVLERIELNDAVTAARILR